ncbi:unnamed protein product [Medioppia subpectinata]|uniref:Uncharacterized protein n=1 Tax=Medioppia subpectinata TaxID=1979941 RepID=A0A7R9KD01_9ACAR|nr:unnamed protein product [Medioppia subpectinata]CAG2101236.1 unnamed protein product [Medioppia subpectinata]
MTTIMLLNEFCANKLKIKSQSIERAFELIRGNDIELPVMSGLSNMATLMMSSGSSGAPKAIIQTNRNLLAIVAITQHPEICPLKSDDIMLSSGFNHLCGQRSLFTSITTGAQLVVLGDDHSNEATFDAIHDMNVTTIFTIPTELNFLIKYRHKYNKTYLKTLRDVFCGGAFLKYGMSECGGVTNVYLSESKCLPNVETIGKVNPGVEIKIIDNLGNSLPPNSIGQICIRGDNVVPDRCKDVINFNGIIVSPVELEKVLLSHELVVNAAVIGVKDEENGEIPMGFVTIKSGAQVGEQELMDYVNNRVNPIKQLRGGVKIVKALPLTPLGKVKKADVKQMNSYPYTFLSPLRGCLAVKHCTCLTAQHPRRGDRKV